METILVGEDGQPLSIEGMQKRIETLEANMKDLLHKLQAEQSLRIDYLADYKKEK